MWLITTWHWMQCSAKSLFQFQFTLSINLELTYQLQCRQVLPGRLHRWWRRCVPVVTEGRSSRRHLRRCGVRCIFGHLLHRLNRAARLHPQRSPWYIASWSGWRCLTQTTCAEKSLLRFLKCSIFQCCCYKHHRIGYTIATLVLLFLFSCLIDRMKLLKTASRNISETQHCQLVL